MYEPEKFSYTFINLLMYIKKHRIFQNYEHRFKTEVVIKLLDMKYLVMLRSHILL